MAGETVEIRRCRHIKVHGAQCGSPALRGDKHCYYHSQSRPERLKVKGADGKTGEVLVPLFEDGASIQMAVRQVVVLLLQDKIDNKKAGLMLYAMQIASTNLKRMEAEKPRPAQVVVDVKTVGETPVGWTPWSLQKGGREPEEMEDKVVARSVKEILRQFENEDRARENQRMQEQLAQITEKMEKCGEEVEEWMAKDDATVDGLKRVIRKVKENVEGVADANLHKRKLSEVEFLSDEEREKWAKEREKRNTQGARTVRQLMKGHRG